MARASSIHTASALFVFILLSSDESWGHTCALAT